MREFKGNWSMDELIYELEKARGELAPRWDEERSARLYAGTLQRKRRRAVQRAAGVSVLTLGAVGALALVLDGGVTGTGSEQPLAGRDHGQSEPPRTGHTLRLADGSSASLVGERSELAVTHNTPSRIGLNLLSGRAHFDVVPNTLRSFVVQVDPYRVEVIGTVFDLTRDARQLHVQVARGKVRVYGPQGARDVAAGEQQRFEISETAQPAAARAEEPEPADAALEADANEVQPARTRARSRRVVAAAGSRPSWRSLSQSGQYEAAFESLRKGAAVEDDAAELMDAADAARLSGHPESAVQYLERVVSKHRQSPVAPLAAFTLGRVYLDKLGQPDRAAHAFEFARKLAPGGSLAQDALAREVEALSKGGNAQKAYVRAQEYLERYPNGRRVRAVQLYGGME